MPHTTEQATLPPERETAAAVQRPAHLVAYLLLGVFFGVVLTKGEVISWFRIQEMFRFQSVHMYGVLGSAVMVAALSLAGIKRYTGVTFDSQPLDRTRSFVTRTRRYWIGGLLFGIGWALLGACPGPIYALIGQGITVMVVALLAALAGAWTYGLLRPKLPH